MAASRTWKAEDGAVTVLVVGLTAALLVLAGLLTDGGRILAARREAFALADNAARAAAQAVDVQALRAGAPVRLDPLAAEEAAHRYLRAADRQGHVVVSGDAVEVRVSFEVNLAVLGVVGLDSPTVTGTGRARAVAGVTGPGG